jgi:hypothetical protein
MKCGVEYMDKREEEGKNIKMNKITYWAEIFVSHAFEYELCFGMLRCAVSAVTMEAASASEMSVNSYQTSRRNIQEDSHLHSEEFHSVNYLKSSIKLSYQENEVLTGHVARTLSCNTWKEEKLAGIRLLWEDNINVLYDISSLKSLMKWDLNAENI